MAIRRAVIFLAIAAGLLLAGCGGGSGSGDQGGATGPVELPYDLKGFPIPPGFELASSATPTASDDPSSPISATWRGKTPLKEVLEFYGAAMVTNTWAEASSQVDADQAKLSYTKGASKADLEIAVSKGACRITVKLTKGQFKLW